MSIVEDAVLDVGATSGEKLNTPGFFKFWRIQNPNAARLLKEIIFRWRGASAYVPNEPGKWVVWPRERWCEWTGLSRNQLDRALKELVESKLIRRERHRFAGSEVRAFLQPTMLALKYLRRPQDMLSVAPSGVKNPEKAKMEASGKTSEKIDEKTGEKTDYTSVSSNPMNSTNLVLTSQEGKGKVGDDDDLDQAIEKMGANKKKALDQRFPELLGPHSKHVRHPSKLFPKWYSFSTEVQTSVYKKYVAYIENWKSGKKGSSIVDELTEEDEAAIISAYAKKAKAVG